MSLSVKTALAVYGKYAAKAAGKPIDHITAEDLIQGILIGRDEMNRGVETDIVDRVLCFRSAYNNEVNLNYVSGDAAAKATFDSPYCNDVRLIHKDGRLTGDIPGYLREALSRALRGEEPPSELLEARPSSMPRERSRRMALPEPVRAAARPIAFAGRWMLMPLIRYADFEGRSCRAEYWMWMLFQAMVAAAFLIVVVRLGLTSGFNEFIAESGLAAAVGTGIVLTLVYALWIPLGVLPLAMLLPLLFSGSEQPSQQLIVMASAIGIFGLAVLIPHWAVAVRRLHDSGQAGETFWHPWAAPILAGIVLGPTGLIETTFGRIVYALAVLMMLGFYVALLVNLVRNGDAGSNEYGSDPAWRNEAGGVTERG